MPQEMTAMDKKYQAENDARTMMEAVQITKDKTRYAACLKEIAKRKAEVNSVSSLLKGLTK